MSTAIPKLAIVKTSEKETIGYFYFQTDTHVVLINNFSPDTINFGPIEGIATKWIEPEVSIHVIPMSDVSSIVELHED